MVKLPTIIFDEIDTGVSGKVAEMMAKIMEEMGLVRLAMDGEQLLAAPVEGCAKVDLNRSVLLRRLKADQRRVSTAVFGGGQ